MFVLSRHALVSILLAVSLAGCGHMPVSTIVQLRKFDFASFDPAPVRIAVRLSDQVEPRKGSALFRMTLTMVGRQPETTRHEFVLEPVPVAAEPALETFRQKNQAIHVFRFSVADGERIRAIQREVNELRVKSAGKGRLQIDVASKACRKGALPQGPLLSSTLIRTDADGPFLVLLRDVDLRAEAAKSGHDLDVEIPPCA